MDTVLLYITCVNRDEAFSIAHALLGEHLVACANIIDNITSLYRWQGELQKSTESLLLAKTHRNRVDAATTLVKKLHSHTTPCIVAVPIEGGNADFLAWIANEVKK